MSAPPPTLDRLRKALPYLLLVGLLAWNAWGHTYWMMRDGTPGGAVCCDMTAGLTTQIAMRQAGGELFDNVQRTLMPGVQTIPITLWHAWVTSDVDAIFQVQGIEFLFAQIALFLAVRAVAGPWAGLLAAVLLPTTPGAMSTARRMTPYPLQLWLLASVWWMLLKSRSLSRPGWVLALVPPIVTGILASNMVTDDVLFGLWCGALGLPAVLRGLVLGRDAWGERVHRGKVAAGTVVLVVLGGGAAVWLHWVRGELVYHAGYILSELGYRPTWWVPGQGHVQAYTEFLGDVPFATMALEYVTTLGDADVGWIGLAAGAAGLLAVAVFGRGMGRAEAVGAVVPFVVLSLITKKQTYYVYYLLLFLAAWPALGLAAVARLRRAEGPTRWLVPGLAVLAGALLYGRAAATWWSLTTTDVSAHMAARAATSPPGPVLPVGPVPPDRAPQEIAWLADVLDSTCPALDGVEAWVGTSAAVAWQLWAWEEGLCLQAPGQPVAGASAAFIALQQPAAWPSASFGVEQPARTVRPPPKPCTPDPDLPWGSRLRSLEAAEDWRQVAEVNLGWEGRCYRLYVREGGRHGDMAQVDPQRAADLPEAVVPFEPPMLRPPPRHTPGQGPPGPPPGAPPPGPR
ncbi:MAG: hypothetical protein H6742_01720 [Alphaproteobacteria bacterium]|nr:hypothetical protein [Alphaproteobacteria bacterium]